MGIGITQGVWLAKCPKCGYGGEPEGEYYGSSAEAFDCGLTGLITLGEPFRCPKCGALITRKDARFISHTP